MQADREKTMCHIALYLPSLQGGGAERVMIMLANNFSGRGYRVDLVLAEAKGAFLSEVAEGIRIVDLGKGRVLTSLVPLVRYLRRERPEAMLSAMCHANIVAIIARKLAGVKMRLAVSEHSAPSRGLAGTGKVAVLRWLVRKLYPSCDAVICVSKDMQKEMEQLLPAPAGTLCTIYNPLDLQKIHRLMETPIAWQQLSRTDSPLILAVGRLTAAKDYPTLLAAFARIRTRRSAKLVIIGDGEEEAALKALVEQLGIRADVAFLGFQANPFAWMKACDVYVLSSQWEGLPGALLEALACGAPVVSTDCKTGPREILEDGRWGRLVPVGEPDALAQAIEAVLDDSMPSSSASRAADFDIDRSSSLYLSVLCGPG